MASIVQQFDFEVSQEEVLGLLKDAGSAGLRIDFKSVIPSNSELVKVRLHHRMSAMTWGENIDIDLFSNADGTCHMNIVSSNSAMNNIGGCNSRNITAIARYIRDSIKKTHPNYPKNGQWTTFSN